MSHRLYRLEVYKRTSDTGESYGCKTYYGPLERLWKQLMKKSAMSQYSDVRWNGIAYLIGGTQRSPDSCLYPLDEKGNILTIPTAHPAAARAKRPQRPSWLSTIRYTRYVDPFSDD